MNRKSIQWFSGQMEQQMKKSDFRQSWESGDIPVLHYFVRLKKETERLYEHIIDYHLKQTEQNAAEVILKAADIANLANIIAAMHSPEMGELSRGRE